MTDAAFGVKKASAAFTISTSDLDHPVVKVCCFAAHNLSKLKRESLECQSNDFKSSDLKSDDHKCPTFCPTIFKFVGNLRLSFEIRRTLDPTIGLIM